MDGGAVGGLILLVIKASLPHGGKELLGRHAPLFGLRLGEGLLAGEGLVFKAVTIIILIILERVAVHVEHVGRLHEAPSLRGRHLGMFARS